MSVIKAKQIIYELDDEDPNMPKKNSRQSQKSLVLEHKLGIATYVKWGTVYNYHFSFDLNKGRLICYKMANSKHPNNHYTLIQGQFVDDEEEVQKKEKIFQKRKNYIPPPSSNDPQLSVVYVRTKKGKTFRLLLNEGENYDKVMGYLQMCFSSKLETEAKTFFALLGFGVIQVNDQGYKLNTGILVSLDKWCSGGVQNNTNYLKQNDHVKDGINHNVMKIGQLVNNIPVIGAIVSAFESSILSLIFNPGSQTVDVILFDKSRQPSQFLYQIFLLVKKQKKLQGLTSHQYLQSNSQTGQMIKLKTYVKLQNETEQYIRVGENKSVQIMCKKCYIPIVSVNIIQSSMLTSAIVEDQINNLSDEREVVAQALNFYKKALEYYPQTEFDLVDEDTKEFILVNPFIIQNNECSPFNSDKSPDKRYQLEANFSQDEIPADLVSVATRDYIVPDENSTDQIKQPLIQETKLIKIQMQRNKSSTGGTPALYPSTPINRKSLFEEHATQQKAVSEILCKLNETSPQKKLSEKSASSSFQSPIKNDIQLQSDQIIQQVEEDDGEVENDRESDEEAAISKAGNVVFPTQQIKGFKNINKYAQEFQWIKQKDEYRVSTANKSGGTACLDKNIVNLSRSVGKTMIKEIGRKIISGNFNLTTISFPIIAMIPKSGLEKAFMQTIYFPLYMNRASQSQNPVERLKLIMVALMCNFPQANSFLKPLNPIIGETFEGSYDDGSLLFAEQISHHPPVSYFLTVGPQKSYKFWGYYLYEAKAGLNSLVLHNKGKRFIEFQDNQKISIDYNQEQYSGTFLGTMKHESIGSVTFTDEKNGLIGSINIGKVKKRPTDYIDGDIKQGSKILSKIYGSYMGFLEWDGQRYWDARHVLPFKIKVDSSILESDHTRRIDRILMIKGDIKQAQIKKDYLEGLQRSETKLRKEYENQKLISEKMDKKKKK